jgi:glutathione reductase (NADPH)
MTDTMAFDYDLFVIGGGSGGVRAGRVAAETGAKVALAEEYRMGGTCVIRGCVPKKLMVFASGYKHAIADAAAYGWNASGDSFDWDRFRPQLDSELDRLEAIYRRNLAKPGVQIFDTRATIKDPHTITLASGKTLTSRHILVATGGHPFIPADLPGCELAITSNQVFKLETLPKSILIVGGGYIACEFAGILNGFGVSVTQYYRGTQILRGFDDQARDLIANSMQAQGISLQLGLDVISLTKTANGILVRASDGTETTFDQVLYATGRMPNTRGIGLEEAGVTLGPQGQIVVDAYSQSSVPSIFAVGDVTDRVTLTPIAIREGAAFVETLFKGNPTKVDHHLVPSAVFTQPEYGMVGLSQQDAAKHEEVQVYATEFNPMQSAFIGRKAQVLFKLVVSKATQKVLGCHIVAPGAAEMIQLAAVAIKMGATKQDFDAVVAVHPTMAEEIVLLKTPV